MIKFFAVSSFFEALTLLKKVRKGVYGGVEQELAKEFKDKTIEQIRANRDMILITTSAMIIKLRLPDKHQRLSKKDGYRLIYLVSQQNDTVVFLTIYPKNGPAQKLDISDAELTFLLEEFSQETNTGTLSQFTFK